jgi:hypothetical protein
MSTTKFAGTPLVRPIVTSPHFEEEVDMFDAQLERIVNEMMERLALLTSKPVEQVQREINGRGKRSRRRGGRGRGGRAKVERDS